jgi:hypothetical protein
MKLLWVAGSAPLSKLIMWGLTEPVSHFAISFDDKIIFQSDLLGVHIEWMGTFLKTHTVVFEQDFNLGLEKEEAIFQALCNQYDGSSYDYGAFAYFIWRAALLKMFKMPLPDRNPWGSKKSFLCDEVIQTLPDEVCPPELKKMDLSIKSPYEVWLLFNQYAVK